MFAAAHETSQPMRPLTQLREQASPSFSRQTASRQTAKSAPWRKTYCVTNERAEERPPSAREHAFDHRAVIDHIVIVVFLDFFSGQLIHINYIVIAFAAGEKLERGSNEPFLVDF
ncbi:MAG: hypothetical protein NOF05_03230 [Candidatus Accumulibacter phosphatis]|uniref:hypothetical protein n=1 Tax=Accumulibacter sp. TaxID=2053492 RepID=UPI002A5E9848|nr:hypothetical protein [Accumulibacter sp.]MCQ1547843.1 hypothetical protein [Candidatus Accumulibacter phosphatis]HMW55931.1 hypothetical protein [Accumulibacter sp.]